jgi:uncharacterized protein YdhG (YjbR/CyaY superfamily)
MSARQNFATVPDYLAALAPPHAKILRGVMATIRKAVPGAEPVISYGIPAFRKERVFIYCAAFRKHIGVYPPVRGDDRLQTALKPYANEKGNLAFPLEKAMPTSLLARVAKALARQSEQGRTVRTKAKPTRKAKVPRDNRKQRSGSP